MPAGFAFPSARIQLWLPSSLDPRQQVDYWAGEFTPLIGRLHPGVTMEQARSEVKSLVSGVWQMFPWPMPRHWNASATAIPLQTDLAGDARGRLLMLLCAVGAVLVISCANVAGLLTARGVARSKELAMRAALGAGRSRIVRQLLTESIVLAGLAGAVGFALGASAIQLFSAVVPSDLPGAVRIGIDWNVAAFSVALSVVAGISFGIAPALSASRLNLPGMVRTGGQRGATPASITFRAWLIAGEVALTLVLVIGAAQLIRSLHALSTADPGFQPQRVLAVKISPNAAFCATPAACIAFYGRVLAEGRGVPGVADTALANTVPLDGSAPSLPMDVEDHPKTAEFPAPMFWTGAVSSGYLRLMGISLLAGRSFTPADTRESEPVVLITASTARRFWPGQNVIGKHIKWVSENRWRTIVGVVADVRQYNLANRAPAGISGAAYLPYAQSVAADGRIPSVMHLIVKTASDAPQAAEEMRRLAVAINPDIPVSPVVRLDALVGESVSGLRSTAWLFLAFAAVALALATIGIYGLVAWSITQRAYEIALRMAIGATGRNILRMVLLQSLRPGLLGVSTGLVVALLVVRSFSALLPDVVPTDPLLYAFVSAFLLGVIILASMVPAWRALRIDPVRVLRAE
jgi:putative ABC transport system permease protein